LFVLTNKKYFL